jgi:hypothetical protein
MPLVGFSFQGGICQATSGAELLPKGRRQIGRLCTGLDAPERLVKNQLLFRVCLPPNSVKLMMSLDCGLGVLVGMPRRSLQSD